MTMSSASTETASATENDPVPDADSAVDSVVDSVADSATDTATASAAELRRKGIRMWMNERARPYRPGLMLAVLLGVLQALVITAQAWVLAAIVDAVVINGEELAAQSQDFLIFAVLIVLRAGLGYGAQITAISAARKLKAGVRRQVLDKIRALGPAFLTGVESGALATTCLERVEALEGYVARFMPQSLLAVLAPLAMLLVVFPTDWVAGVIFLVTAPLIPMFMALVGMGADHVHKQQFDQLARMGAHFLDRVRGIATLKLFGAAKAEADKVSDISDQYRISTMQVLGIAFLSSAVMELFSSIAIAMIAIYVGFSLLGLLGLDVIAPTMQLSVGLFLLLLAPDYFMPMRKLATHYHDRAAALGAAEDIVALLEKAVPDQAGLQSPARPPPQSAIPDIRFENVSLCYGGFTALDRLNLTIKAGEAVALVGPSGAGKSSILNLILGFLPPDDGRVIWNGADLRALDLATVQAQTALVSQRSHAFFGTVRENIALPPPDASDAEIMRAADVAGAARFIRQLPQGLDTRLGERGVGLSGGQVQRLALARAFLKDAPLLLLDEPTSALDEENEQIILDAIARLRHGRTVIMATHSHSAAASMDRSLHLDHGRWLNEGAP